MSSDGVALVEHEDAGSALIRLFPILKTIEENGLTGTCTLVGTQGEGLGHIVSSQGKVCLIAGVVGVERFGDVLRRKHPKSATALARALRRASEEKILVGEALLGLGEVPLVDIRACLLTHVTDGLFAAASAEITEVRTHSSKLSYNDKLTFPPMEAYWSATERIALDNSSAVRLFNEFGDSSSAATLCLRRGRQLAPLHTRGIQLDSLDEVGSVSKFLQRFVNPPALQAADIQPTVMLFGEESSFSVVCISDNFVGYCAGLSAKSRGQVMRFLSTVNN